MIKFETPLCELAYKYGTDKCPQIVHNYTPFYYELFKDRQKSTRKLAELGIGYAEDVEPPSPPHYQTGAGLLMWRDFFPNAQIYGADISIHLMEKSDRITTFFCNEESKSDLENFINQIGSDIDVFIDDGLHTKKNQVFVCKMVMPLLWKGVTYVIEDVRASNDVVMSLPEYDCEIIRFDKRKMKRRDDCLIIVRHKR